MVQLPVHAGPVLCPLRVAGVHCGRRTSPPFQVRARECSRVQLLSCSVLDHRGYSCDASCL